MLRKGKRLPVMILPALIIVFLGSLFGCSDNTADPMGTGTIQFYDATSGAVITSATIQPGDTYTLVIKVRSLRSDGTLAPVIGERIAFTLSNPANGGGLTVVNNRTAGDGQAMAVYTAGNNFAVDSVRATTSNGATATITITKQGGLIGARISSLAASSTALVEGQTSAITATVTDGNANPMMGEAVTFTIATNDSGACFINAANACVISVIVNTDASGSAVAVYHGGSNSPDADVYDTVRATLANGSTNFVMITRSAGAPISIAVAASPASVSAGQVSIVTATLTGDDNVGVTVTFTLSTTIGSTLSPTTATTDGAGKAVATYTAGILKPTISVQDTVSATVGSVSSTVAITRTDGTVPMTTITLTASPASITSVVTGGTANLAITATVKDSDGVVKNGVAVTFTANNSGTTNVIDPTTATDYTHSDGKANYTFSITNAATGTLVFTATTSDASAVISVSITVPTP
jgi:hypothetical protein